jgi:hypothetical protein
MVGSVMFGQLNTIISPSSYNVAGHFEVSELMICYYPSYEETKRYIKRRSGIE